MDYKKEVAEHCLEIEKCNQRGGRMLSVVDLIKAGNLSVFQSALLMERIFSGCSFIIGAKPGGAGKTTVMCALLNFLPLGVNIIHTENRNILAQGNSGEQTCYLCHEIGSGNYYCYLWGEDLPVFFKLKQYGHILAANLHADTFQEAEHQVCVRNSVSEKLFHEVEIYVFLEVEKEGWDWKRKVSKIYIRDDTSHRLISEKNFAHFSSVNFDRLERCRGFMEKAVRNNLCRMEEFRKEFIMEFG